MPVMPPSHLFMFVFLYNRVLMTRFSFPAEFVISLAEKNPSVEDFKSVLIKNGAEFTVSDASYSTLT